MNRNSTIVLTTLLLALFFAGAVLLFTPPPPAAAPKLSSPQLLAVTDMPDGLFEVDPEHWHSFFRRGRPSGTGWVALPEQSDSSMRPPRPHKKNVVPKEFVDAHVCGECHRTQLNGFLQTAHHHTSRLAGSDSVLGNFQQDSNRMETNDPHLFFRMERVAHGFYQRVNVTRGRQTYMHRQRIDLVTGSGNHGQTYLYWKGDALYQLPLSFLTESQRWVNSPGFYRNGTADFSRPITSRCLECHATHVEHVAGTANRYVRSQTVLGVSCVRCHGRGDQHVSFHRENPDTEHGRHIVHPGKLSRQRSNEICAQCHSGIGHSLQPPFSYRPGDPLDEYLKLEHRGEQVLGGVHTDDQLARLEMSRCFQASDSMTCATCHDPHRAERGHLALFSERCLSCHQLNQCWVYPKVGDAIRKRCIDCHMPKRRDSDMKFHTDGGMVDLLLLRDHFIRGWPESTEQVLREIQADGTGDAAGPKPE